MGCETSMQGIWCMVAESDRSTQGCFPFICHAPLSPWWTTRTDCKYSFGESWVCIFCIQKELSDKMRYYQLLLCMQIWWCQQQPPDVCCCFLETNKQLLGGLVGLIWWSHRGGISTVRGGGVGWGDTIILLVNRDRNSWAWRADNRGFFFRQLSFDRRSM